MKAVLREDIAQAYINQARRVITGELALPRVQYKRDNSVMHLSDLQGCPLRTYYNKIYGEKAPPITDSSVLYFTRGRQVERALMFEGEQSSEADGVHCTADDLHPDFDYGEIKSTAEQMDFFDPLTAHIEWIERILGYCYAFKQTEWNLIVLFMVGNMPNRLWWNIKEYGKSKEPYKGIALKAWRLSFSEGEIISNWDIMLGRKRKLEECLRIETPPSRDWIGDSIESWMCKTCQMKDMCYYLEEKNREE